LQTANKPEHKQTNREQTTGSATADAQCHLRSTTV